MSDACLSAGMRTNATSSSGSIFAAPKTARLERIRGSIDAEICTIRRTFFTGTTNNAYKVLPRIIYTGCRIVNSRNSIDHLCKDLTDFLDAQKIAALNRSLRRMRKFLSVCKELARSGAIFYPGWRGMAGTLPLR